MSLIRRHADPLTTLRFQRDIEHLHLLGPRSIAEFLTEIGTEVNALPLIQDRLAEYRRRLSPEMVRLVGADRFPPSLSVVMPS